MTKQLEDCKPVKSQLEAAMRARLANSASTSASVKPTRVSRLVGNKVFFMRVLLLWDIMEFYF